MPKNNFSPASPEVVAPAPGKRPGWPELIISLVVVLALEVILARLVLTSGVGSVAKATFMTALSAIVAGGGFLAAYLLRVRKLAAFGVKSCAPKWVLLGIAAGIVAVFLKIPLTMLYTLIFGPVASAQDSWADAATGGIVPVLLSLFFLGVLTPVGEELLFRGVVTTVLLRYGAIIGVIGSTLIFAVLHGQPIIMLSAVLVGLPAGELRRRTGSIWPGVALHMTFDLISGVGIFLILPAITH